MAEDGGTFLEEFINTTELLPNDIRRNSELMRELDRDSAENAKEIEIAEVRATSNTWPLYVQHHIFIVYYKRFVLFISL
jgi:hypothetical protein